MIDYKYEIGQEFIVVEEPKFGCEHPRLIVRRVIDKKAEINKDGVEISYILNDEKGWTNEQNVQGGFECIDNAIEDWLSKKIKLIEREYTLGVKELRRKKESNLNASNKIAAHMKEKCAFKEKIIE